MSIMSYIGSKTNDGYTWDRTPASSPIDYLEYGAASVTAHKIGTYPIDSDARDWATAVNYTVINHKDLDIDFDDIETREHCFFDPSTTLKIVLLLNDAKKELLVCFGAKNSFVTECTPEEHSQFNIRQLTQIFGNLTGFVPQSYPLAAKIVSRIGSLDAFKGYRKTLVGHSHGGSIAQYVSLMNKIPAMVINSAPLGAGLQMQLGSGNLKRAPSLIKHLSVDGDYLSHSYWFYGVDRVLSAIGIKTPGSFGKRETIPSAFSGTYGHHSYIMGSIGNAAGIGNPQHGKHLEELLRKHRSQKTALD